MLRDTVIVNQDVNNELVVLLVKPFFRGMNFNVAQVP